MSWQFLKPLRTLMRKFRSATRLPLSHLALTGLVWLLLWLARLVLFIFPLRRVARFYGHDQGVDAFIPIASPTEINRALHIRRAIALAVKYSHSAANCYPQALVARLMLRAARLPHALFFGLKRDKDSEKMDAHAWVMVGPVAVSGGNSFANYTVVRCYATVREMLEDRLVY